jgi:ATP-binding cassette subfamily C protein
MEKFKLIKLIPQYQFLLVLIFLSGFAEGIGLSALVPVVSTLTNGDQFSAPAPFNKLPVLIKFLGLEPTFEVLLVLTLVLMILSFAMVFFQQIYAAKAQLTFLETIREKAVKTLFQSKWPYLARISSGQSSNTIISEAERGAEAIMALVNLLATSFLLFIYMCFAFILSWKMFIIAAFTIVFAVFFGKRLIRRVRKTGKERVEMNSQFYKEMVEYIRAIKLIKATSLTEKVLQKLEAPNKNTASSLKEILVSSAKMRFELQTIISCAMVLILYVAITYLSVPISTLLVFMYIVMRLAPKFSTMQGQYHSFSAHYPALDILESLIKKSEENKESTFGNKTLDSFSGEITLSNISYTYPNSEGKTLHDVSLKIHSKEFVSFVGKSGSGKTTLVDLIMGLLKPTSGVLKIDGMDLSEVEIQSFRKRIGLVSQDSHFFSGSIRDNLTIDTICDDEYLWKCLEVAQVKEFVESLTNGLDTIIGESGVNVSGGQAQRLAIARALARKPSLLILDEATSSLDKQSEADFQKAIESISNDYTIISIAHKFQTIKNSDKIFLLSEGNIVEEGNFQELCSNKGPFFELLNTANIEFQTSKDIM